MAVHFPHGPLVHPHIVADMRISMSQLRIAVLHVRHVDVDDALEQREGFGTVIATGIVDQRQGKALSRRLIDRRDDLRNDMARGDEDRVGSGRLFRIASILGVPITAFFEGAHQTANEDAGPSPVAMLAEPYVLRLLRAFCGCGANSN